MVRGLTRVNPHEPPYYPKEMGHDRDQERYAKLFRAQLARAEKAETTEKLRAEGIEAAPPRRRLGEKALRKALAESLDHDEDVDELFSLE